MSDRAGCMDNEIYVSSADHAKASEIAEKMGLGALVCENRQPEDTMTEVEKAEAEFMRKRKRTYIEALVILAAAVLFLLIRSWM